MTPTQKMVADLSALIRSRHVLIWINTREELRAEQGILEAALKSKMDVHFWDCSTGEADASNATLDANLRDPNGMLAKVRDTPERRIYVLRDLHRWFDPVVLRTLRSTARKLQGVATASEARTIILVSPVVDVPPDLTGQVTVLDWPLPDREEIAAVLDQAVKGLPDAMQADAVGPNGMRDAVIDAAIGLTADEAANTFAKSCVQTRRIESAIVSAEKKRVISREKVLTWIDPEPRGLDAIGGLDELKGWLIARKSAFSKRAREFGLPAPKGCLLVGVPGCGKSLTAKAVATAWGMPLLRLDMGALKSKWVGESEANIRRALSVAETVAPCVLWCDEVEKALAGATGQAADGGVSADALGAVLSWMQDRAGAVFMVATANDVSNLPPELLRKGRFDEVWFVGLPSQVEREAVLRATLKQFKREVPEPSIASVARATAGFTGAELAALVPDALFAAFADGERALSVGDLVGSAKRTTPLSKTAGEKIAALQKWAVGKARPASRAETEDVRQGRAIDVD